MDMHGQGRSGQESAGEGSRQPASADFEGALPLSIANWKASNRVFQEIREAACKHPDHELQHGQASQADKSAPGAAAATRAADDDSNKPA